MLTLCDCNPFLRAAMIQDAVLEGEKPRRPYDNRIFFVYKGNAVIIINGQEKEIKENSLVYLGVKDEYYFRGKIRAAVLNFDMTTNCRFRTTPLFPPSKADYDDRLIFDDTEIQGYESAFVTDVDEMLKREINELVNAFIHGNDYFDAICSAMLKKILADVLISLQKKKTANDLLANNVMLYIKDNATDIDQNTNLGKIFGYHPVYLAAVFKNQFNKTLHSAISEEKLCVAARLLTYTDNSVEEIALKSGFSTRGYFCTAFKRHFGINPTAYRKNHRIIQL